VAETAAAIRPALDELIRQAAQGEVLHNDDTSMRVLALNRAQARAEFATERTGVFTSGIVSTAPGRNIALFFTGEQHAGENLADVLQWRATELRAPSRCVMPYHVTYPSCHRKTAVRGSDA
jgi:hypothetical protein